MSCIFVISPSRNGVLSELGILLSIRAQFCSIRAQCLQFVLNVVFFRNYVPNEGVSGGGGLPHGIRISGGTIWQGFPRRQPSFVPGLCFYDSFPTSYSMFTIPCSMFSIRAQFILGYRYGAILTR